MNKMYLMVGVAGVGKSTYISKHLLKDNSDLFSSDTYRKLLYGGLKEGNKHNNEVFNALHKDLKHYLETGDNKTAIYDATNLSRKRRRGVYEEFKGYAKVTIIFMYKPLEVIIRQNENRTGDANVPQDAIKRMYNNLQIPRVGVDCDEVIVDSKHYFKENYLQSNTVAELADKVISPELAQELLENYTLHNSPYHKEDVNTHIELTIRNSIKSGLTEVALFHDLGKGLSKEFVSEDHARFIGHENIGAVYAFIALNAGRVVIDNDPIPEVIFHHMQANQNALEKPTRLDKLTEQELYMLKSFSEIDKKSRLL